MIVTEQEAKLKRCQESFPAALVTTQDGGLIPSAAVQFGAISAIHTAPTHCLGSMCMGWRWHYHPDDVTGDEAPKGYCGKAGP